MGLERSPEITHLSSVDYWLGAALLVVSWQFGGRPAIRSGTGICVSAAGLSWAALRTLQGGAEVAVLAAIGMGYTIAWYRRGESGTPTVAMALGGLSLALGFGSLRNIESSESYTFPWIASASICIAVQGWLLKRAPSRVACWRDPIRSWAHASTALLLSQAALVTPALGLNDVATPLWGIASVGLFLGGLTGGIRAYRMIGLLGLLFCLGRMFAVDVQNTFYRIIAFAVVGLFLLGVGFLYTRFRDWIESNDENSEAHSSPAS